MADKEMVKLVLRNLISNAIKYCRQGDSVVVSDLVEDSFVTVSVRDTGVGVPEEIRQKLFQGIGYSSRGLQMRKEVA